MIYNKETVLQFWYENIDEVGFDNISYDGLVCKALKKFHPILDEKSCEFKGVRETFSLWLYEYLYG